MPRIPRFPKIELPALPSTLPVLRGLHLAARKGFETLGYEWEERRFGELKLGLWRVPLRRGAARANPPRRFVLMPGLGDTPLSWLGVFALLNPALRRSYDEAVLIDFPGFSGFLSGEKCFPTMDLLFSSLADTFDSLKPHTIFGHSLGGWIAARYAVDCGGGRRPTQGKGTYSGPETLILCNPSGVFADANDKAEWLKRFELGIQHGFEAFGKHVFRKEPPWFRWVAGDFLGFMTRDDVVQFMLSVRDDHEVEKHLHEVKAKTWVFWGEDDTLAPSKWARDWLRGLPIGARAVLIPKAGHSPHIERPAVTAAALSQVLLGREPHPAGARFWKLLSASTSNN